MRFPGRLLEVWYQCFRSLKYKPWCLTIIMLDPKYRQDVTTALSAVDHIPELRGSAKYYLLDRWKKITALYLVFCISKICILERRVSESWRLTVRATAPWDLSVKKNHRGSLSRRSLIPVDLLMCSLGKSRLNCASLDVTGYWCLKRQC